MDADAPQELLPAAAERDSGPRPHRCLRRGHGPFAHERVLPRDVRCVWNHIDNDGSKNATSQRVSGLRRAARRNGLAWIADIAQHRLSGLASERRRRVWRSDRRHGFLSTAGGSHRRRGRLTHSTDLRLAPGSGLRPRNTVRGSRLRLWDGGRWLRRPASPISAHPLCHQPVGISFAGVRAGADT